jgi:hypothetical protein
MHALKNIRCNVSHFFPSGIIQGGRNVHQKKLPKTLQCGVILDMHFQEIHARSIQFGLGSP